MSTLINGSNVIVTSDADDADDLSFVPLSVLDDNLLDESDPLEELLRIEAAALEDSDF